MLFGQGICYHDHIMLMHFDNMDKKLPAKLKKEPLIDAVFEVRFSGIAPTSFILPGILFNELEGEKIMGAFPIAQLPKPVRDADPNLKYAPLSRIEWQQFIFSVSDFSVSVSCKYPYPGWKVFKPAIIKLMEILVKSNIVKEVERYSMKYIDLIPEKDIQQIVGMFNIELLIASHKLEKEQFHIRIDIPKDGFIHTVQIVSSAQAVLNNGINMEGAIIDIDTVVAQNNISIQSLMEGLTDKLENIHMTNKAMFFNCLKPCTVDTLEPIYD